MLRILLLILLFPVLSSQAQQVPTVDQYFPSPPNAASLAKYSEIPVDKFSGTSNISIPIYTLTEGDLAVPISLNYHTGGIKVTEVASWAGLGWALSAGGSITRQVNGSIDEGGYDPGDGNITQGWYLNGNNFSNEFIEVDNNIYETLINNNCNEGSVPIEWTLDKFELSKAISRGIKDTEPDIFYLNIPGYNGKFYFNENQEIIFDPFQNIEVEVYHTPGSNDNDDYSWFTGFKVTTPDGTKYYFGNNTDALDRSYSFPYSGDVLGSDQIVNTWHLTSIKSLNDDFQINFEYEKQFFYDYSFSGASVVNTAVFNNTDFENSITVTGTEEARLSRISSTHLEVVFTPNQVRQDLLSKNDLVPQLRDLVDFGDNDMPRLLNMIEVNTTNEDEDIPDECIAKFTLNHEYFADGYDLTLLQNIIDDSVLEDKKNFTQRRPKLGSLVQTSCTNDETFIHEFSYKDGPGTDLNDYPFNLLPSRLSFQQDHWGYYTNSSTDGIFPDLNMIPEAVVQDNGNYPAPNAFAVSGFLSNRSANEDFSGALSLTGITYPTGAQQLITTEGNTVSRREFEDDEASPTSFGTMSNCNFGPDCCQNESTEFLNLSLPGPVVNNGMITYYSLVARITPSSSFGCEIPDVDEYQGFLVVERIDLNGVKTVFSEHINLPTTSTIGYEVIRSFGLGLTEKVRKFVDPVKESENPACWWNPTKAYNIYFYKGANESDTDRHGDPIKLSLEIKTVTANISNTMDYHVGGRRIASISEVDGDKTYTTAYSYADENSNYSSGVILDFPKYVFFNRVRVPIQCTIDPPYEFPYLTRGTCDPSNFIFRSSPVFPLTSTIGSSMGYRVVTETRVVEDEQSEGYGEDLGKTVSTFITDCVGNEENHYPESWFSFKPKKLVFPKISKLIGKMINQKQISGNSNQDIIAETKFQYEEKDFANGDGFYNHRPRFAVPSCGSEVGLFYFKETLPSSYVQMVEKKETLDGLETITQYNYRDDKKHINPIEIKVSRNGRILQTTNNYYPQDILENPDPDPHLVIASINRMINRNMVNVMVKSESSGLETKGFKNVMGIQGDRILPWKQFSKERDTWVQQSQLIYDNNDDPFPDGMKLKSHQNDLDLNWIIPFSSLNGGLLESQSYDNHTVSFGYHNDRRLYTRTEIDNQSTHYTYDGFKRLQQVKAYGASGGLKSTTTNTYNVGGDNFILTSVDFPDNKFLRTKNSYRPSGLLDKTTRLFYGPSAENIVTDAYEYDEFKRLESSTNYQTGETTFTYYPDPLNRLHTETYSDGSVTTCEYDSDQTLLSNKKVIDENGNVSIAHTDLLGRPVYNDRLLNGQVVRTSYDYVSFGALEKVTTPKGGIYGYDYDSRGRLKAKNIPGQGEIKYTYDAFYRIETMTDANGVVQTYDYDPYNRNTRTLVDGTLISENFYDKDDQDDIYQGKIYKTMHLTTENNSFGDELITDFEYDQFGRTESEVGGNHIGGNDEIGFTYDFMDNILTSSKKHTGYSTELTINSNYVYDHSFRMKSEDIKVNNDPTIQLKENKYNVKDQLIETGMYGKINTRLQLVNYDYNGRGWLTRINEVDENGIPLVACKGGGGSTPCETCTKNYTAAKSQSSSSPFVIVDAYGGGGKLIPLEYPYPSNQLNKFENDLKSWLIENEFAFEAINVSWENGVFQVSALESVFELNSLNISDENANKSEMIFVLPNGEDFIENENEYCGLCQQFGYDCATCPVWELVENCPACPDLDQQVLELLDCDNCDIGGYGVLPKQLNLKLNPEVFLASEDQAIYWDAATVLYLKDGEGIGFHPAGTYLTGNPFNVVADQSDVYLSFQLPQVIIAKDNQIELENYIKDKLNEELKQLFIDLEQFDDNLGNRLQALSTAVSGKMMDKISPFAKEVSEKINSKKLTPDPGGPTLPALDLFKLNLNYQEGHEVSGMPRQLNGNISGMTWQTGNERKRTYGFRYDDLDRLKIARYSDWQINNTWSFDAKFSTSYGYDLDGNFTSILRQGALRPCGLKDPSIYSYGRIDYLSFEYNDQNQLQKVGDESVDYRGFKNGSSTYSYDGMGTLMGDTGKGLTVTNNFLNLPTNMSLGAGEISIKYLATGEKLRKWTSSDQGDTTVDYCGNIEYENGELAAIHHSTGRIIPADNNGKEAFRYQFQLTDHLGNVRIVFEDKNQDGSITKINPEGGRKNPFIIDEEEIITVNHYYPFGLQMTGPAIDEWYGGVNGRKYDYSYNGKELNEDFGLDWSDYGARWYDATIGRWGGVDPLAADYASWSPYNYVMGNPIRLVDPDGRSPDDFVQRSDGSIYWDNNANSQGTTKSGETYLGKELTFSFNSYIDADLWDGPGGSIPAGDKLTSTITLTGSENSSGELTGISATKSVAIGPTPVGTGRDFFPGLGDDQNKASATSSSNADGTLASFSLNFEQHASVAPIEHLGLNILGYDIVNVAQNLQLNYSGGNLSVSAGTDIFPSATLSVNNNQLFKYNQPSFEGTHRSRLPLGRDDGLMYRPVTLRPAPTFYNRYNN